MKAFKNIFLFSLIAVGAVFVLNAVILFCANPVSLHGQDKSTVFKDFGLVEVRSVDNLRSGGLGKASLPVFGYVNMTDKEDIIYLNKEIADKSPNFTQSSYFYKHEMAHIYQKSIVAEKAGGYPSYVNPVQSFKYYKTLFELDKAYQELMPAFNNEEEFSLFPGLETSAECFAQPKKITPKFNAPYVDRGYCLAEERKVIFGMVVGKWPTELTEQQQKELQHAGSIWELPYTPLPQNSMKAV